MKSADQDGDRQAELMEKVKVLEGIAATREESLKAKQRKVDELNLQLGDKDAEIAVLHASLSDVRKGVDVILTRMKEIAQEMPSVTVDRCKAILEQIKTELGGLGG